MKYKFLKYVFIALFFSFNLNLAHTQTPILNKKISISASNEKLIDVLEEIEKIAGFHFTYNSALIPENKIVSLNVSDKSITEILDELINDKTIEYKEIKNQVVIYQPDRYKTQTTNTIKKSQINKQRPLTQAKEKIITIYDTIITHLLDTIIAERYDTVTIYDTIIYYDTLTPVKQKNTMQRFKGWSLDLFLSPSYSSNIMSASYPEFYKIIESKNEAEKPLLTYGFGVNINYNVKNWIINSGVSYTQYRQRADYNITNVYIYTTFDTIPTWEYEHIVTYYKLNPGGDTVWISIYDSSLVDKAVPKSNYDTTQTKYEEINNYKYLEIPLLIGYRFKFNEKIACSIKGGICAGFFINANGKTVSANDENTLENIEDLPFTKTNFSFLSTLTLEYKMTRKLSIIVEPFYKVSLNSIFESEYPINEKFRSFGSRFGLRYFF